MNLKDYFEEKKGFGILATADSKGRVDAAVYGRPHFIDDTTVAFIMADRLTHSNLQTNPHAAYLFRESGEGYKGKRLFLSKIRDEEDIEKVEQMRRRSSCPVDEDYVKEKKFIVYFKIDKVLPLIGSEEK
jgi:hypothetical protein